MLDGRGRRWSRSGSCRSCSRSAASARRRGRAAPAPRLTPLCWCHSSNAWTSHVRFHRTGTKTFHHPAIGDFELAFQAMQLPGDGGLTLFAYTAAPGTPAADALALLATWAATERTVTGATSPKSRTS
ncbi:MmyB family transcriptional regulator [Plantibacter cousiniae (nom. nud.)]|uniref:MmyB family transcriptional regulator n=1 Tax=Plantibacter cousiniae (nom. nud.) TaxID=199709 RepID=UPI001E51D6AC|nr:hypothetical protein [Plantibacter cousiniae]